MRETFREHPRLKFNEESRNLGWEYYPTDNVIFLGKTEGEPIKCLVHEITHWAMNAFLHEEETEDTNNKYDKLRNGKDVLSFFQISIEERTATYIEEMVNE